MLCFHLRGLKARNDIQLAVQVFFNVCEDKSLRFHAVVLQGNCSQNIVQVRLLLLHESRTDAVLPPACHRHMLLCHIFKDDGKPHSLGYGFIAINPNELESISKPAGKGRVSFVP